MTPNEEKEVLELFIQYGAEPIERTNGNDHTKTYTEYTVTKDEFLAFAAAIRSQDQAQIAMLVDLLKRLPTRFDVGMPTYRIEVNKVLGSTQQSAEAFLAEHAAKEVKKAMELLLEHGEDHDWRIMAKNMGSNWQELRKSAEHENGK